jgi:hypothetical protein
MQDTTSRQHRERQGNTDTAERRIGSQEPEVHGIIDFSKILVLPHTCWPLSVNPSSM